MHSKPRGGGHGIRYRRQLSQLFFCSISVFCSAAQSGRPLHACAGLPRWLGCCTDSESHTQGAPSAFSSSLQLKAGDYRVHVPGFRPTGWGECDLAPEQVNFVAVRGRRTGIILCCVWSQGAGVIRAQHPFIAPLLSPSGRPNPCLSQHFRHILSIICPPASAG